jgi:beta-glucosidase-like glycosyl hydrolase
MSSRILGQELRQRMGYRGVIFSDDLEMKAVRGRFPLETQLRQASVAGVDVFLCCKELPLVHEAQESLAIDSLKRLHGLRERFLANRGPPPGLEVLGSPAHRELALRANLGRA